MKKWAIILIVIIVMISSQSIFASNASKNDPVFSICNLVDRFLILKECYVGELFGQSILSEYATTNVVFEPVPFDGDFIMPNNKAIEIKPDGWFIERPDKGIFVGDLFN